MHVDQEQAMKLIEAATMALRADHSPRPDWTCATYGDTWPCDEARVILYRYFDDVTLLVLMTLLYGQAGGDPAQREQFMGWLNDPRSAGSSPGQPPRRPARNRGKASDGPGYPGKRPNG